MMRRKARENEGVSINQRFLKDTSWLMFLCIGEAEDKEVKEERVRELE